MIELTRRTKHFQLAFIIIFITSFDTNLNCLLIKVEILLQQGFQFQMKNK